MMNGGAIVAQTIINTLSSAKNAPTVRDLEIHQVKKGNDWQLGMKRCFDVDAGSGLGHIMTVTVANEYDITETGKFLRKDDAVVYGNSGHLGVQKRHQICWNRHLLASHINRRHKWVTMRLTGKDTLKTANHPFAAKWSKHSELKMPVRLLKLAYWGLKKWESPAHNVPLRKFIFASYCRSRTFRNLR